MFQDLEDLMPLSETPDMPGVEPTPVQLDVLIMKCYAY